MHSLRLGYLSGQLGLASVPSALLILCAQPAGGHWGTQREKERSHSLVATPKAFILGEGPPFFVSESSNVGMASQNPVCPGAQIC